MSSTTPLGRTDHITLDTYEELVGDLLEIELIDNSLIIKTSSGNLRFPITSTEAELCESNLEGKEGQTVGILRTGKSTKPILIDVKES